MGDHANCENILSQLIKNWNETNTDIFNQVELVDLENSESEQCWEAMLSPGADTDESDKKLGLSWWYKFQTVEGGAYVYTNFFWDFLQTGNTVEFVCYNTASDPFDFECDNI